MEKIEWNKIITNAISALVVTVFLGAATIVWKGATSVDTKVQSTRQDMTHLIDTLSEKLAGYEVQLSSLSNQLAVVINNQSNAVSAMDRTPNSPKVVLEKTAVNPDSLKVQTKARTTDIMQQLQRPLSPTVQERIPSPARR